MSSKGTKKSNSENHSAPLDLGLSALLTGHTAQPQRDPSSSPHISASREPSGDAKDPALGERPVSEFEALFRKNSWGELAKLAETKLAFADEPEFRLWWVRGHLGGFSMPVSFLAAPLEAVCRRARDNQFAEELRPVLRETGALALARLKEVGARDQVESLRDSLLDAGVLESEPPVPSAVEKARESVSVTASTVAPVEDRSSSSHPRKIARAAPNGFRSLLIGGVLLAIILVGWGVWSWFQVVFGVPAVIAAENFVSEPRAVEQLIPSLDRRGPVGSLSALFYSIEAPEPLEPAEEKAPPAPAGAHTSQTAQAPSHPDASRGASGERAPPKQERPPSVPGRKVQIDTRSPVEGQELKERLRRRETRPPPETAREPIVREPERNSSAPVMENRNPDVFDPGGVYRVLVNTSVLANPSYSAEVVGRLEPGDRVFVEGKLGRWVRLRSKRGRGGFVLAEDVAEIPR
jgi:hypothetical protein